MIAKVPTENADEKSENASSTLKDSSLKTAGIAYLVGDTAMFLAGILEDDIGGAFGGAIWGLGSLAAARYGNPSAEKQLKLLNQRLNTYLRKQGVEVPKSPTTHELAKEGGVIEHIEKFLYTNPSQTLNAIYALGGVTTATGGFRKDIKSDAAKGMLVTAGGLAGLLIPEKQPDPTHPPKDTLEKIWSWIQEKPLRASGLLYHANNAVSVYGIREKWKKQEGKSKINLYLRAITATSFIFANTMLALSSKGHGDSAKNTNELTSALAQESAQIIAAQPKEVQEVLVQNIAGYLSAQPEIKKTAPEIAELLHAKLGKVRESLPVAGKWQNHVQKGSEPSLSPSV